MALEEGKGAKETSMKTPLAVKQLAGYLETKTEGKKDTRHMLACLSQIFYENPTAIAIMLDYGKLLADEPTEQLLQPEPLP